MQIHPQPFPSESYCVKRLSIQPLLWKAGGKVIWRNILMLLSCLFDVLILCIEQCLASPLYSLFLRLFGSLTATNEKGVCIWTSSHLNLERLLDHWPPSLLWNHQQAEMARHSLPCFMTLLPPQFISEPIQNWSPDDSSFLRILHPFHPFCSAMASGF